VSVFFKKIFVLATLISVLLITKLYTVPRTYSQELILTKAKQDVSLASESYVIGQDAAKHSNATDANAKDSDATDAKVKDSDATDAKAEDSDDIDVEVEDADDTLDEWEA
jgi:hypothetical protein